MAVFRVNKAAGYTVMSNHHLQDRTISLKAKGLLSVMLSLPPKWDFSIRGLAAISLENESAISSALKELKVAGYLIVLKIPPNKTKSGRYEYIYDIYETPQKTRGEKQGVEIQGVEKQGVEIQGVENRPLNKDIKEENTKDKILKINYESYQGQAPEPQVPDENGKRDQQYQDHMRSVYQNIFGPGYDPYASPY